MKTLKELFCLFLIGLVFMSVMLWGYWEAIVIGAVAFAALLYNIIKLMYPDNELDDKIESL